MWLVSRVEVLDGRVGVLSTALGGWQDGFEAEGVDVAEYGRRIHGM